MALKKLGSSYLVGANTVASRSDDPSEYRGNKDFLVWNTSAGTRVSLGSIRLSNNETFDIIVCRNLLLHESPERPWYPGCQP